MQWTGSNRFACYTTAILLLVSTLEPTSAANSLPCVNNETASFVMKGECTAQAKLTEPKLQMDVDVGTRLDYNVTKSFNLTIGGAKVELIGSYENSSGPYPHFTFEIKALCGTGGAQNPNKIQHINATDGLLTFTWNQTSQSIVYPTNIGCPISFVQQDDGNYTVLIEVGEGAPDNFTLKSNTSKIYNSPETLPWDGNSVEKYVVYGVIAFVVVALVLFLAVCAFLAYRKWIRPRLDKRKADKAAEKESSQKSTRVTQGESYLVKDLEIGQTVPESKELIIKSNLTDSQT